MSLIKTNRGVWLILLIFIVSMIICICATTIWMNKMDEEIQVDGTILEKNKNGPNYIFIVMRDNGEVLKLKVDFQDYYTYGVGDYYSAKVRRGNIIEEPSYSGN